MATTLDPTEARERARQEIGAGNNCFVHVPDELLPAQDGPLHGLPFAVKDVMDCVGEPTCHGAYDYSELPVRSAVVVERLVAAGAVPVGKTHTHQFAFGTTGDISASGPVTNPVNPAKMAGGSSGGSAVAVATGIVPFALGTDTAGSVRIPAALVGCVGFKPTWDVLPLDGIMPLSPSLDAVGILANSVETVAQVWPTISQSEVDLESVDLDQITFRDLTDLVSVRTSSRIRRIWDQTVGRMTGRTNVVDLDAAVDLERLRASYRTIIGHESEKIHAPIMGKNPKIYSPQILERINNIRGVSEADYQEALDWSRAEGERIFEHLGNNEFLIMPTVGIETPLIGQRDIHDDSGVSNVWGGLAEQTCPWNVVGFPAISLPIPVGEGEMSVGLQIIGRPHEDEKLLSVAMAVAALLAEGES